MLSRHIGRRGLPSTQTDSQDCSRPKSVRLLTPASSSLTPSFAVPRPQRAPPSPLRSRPSPGPLFLNSARTNAPPLLLLSTNERSSQPPKTTCPRSCPSRTTTMSNPSLCPSRRRRRRASFLPLLCSGRFADDGNVGRTKKRAAASPVTASDDDMPALVPISDDEAPKSKQTPAQKKA